MKKSELRQIIREEIIQEITSNTSKLFNKSWSDYESAKEINRRIKKMDDDELLRILGNDPMPKRLNTPRNIQIALIYKEMKRRGLKLPS